MESQYDKEHTSAKTEYGNLKIDEESTSNSRKRRKNILAITVINYYSRKNAAGSGCLKLKQPNVAQGRSSRQEKIKPEV